MKHLLLSIELAAMLLGLAAMLLGFTAPALAQSPPSDSTTFVVTLPTDLTQMSGKDWVSLGIPLLAIIAAFTVKWVRPLIPDWLIGVIPLILNSIIGFIGVPTNIAMLVLMQFLVYLIQKFMSQGLTRSAGAVQYLPDASFAEKLGFKDGSPRIPISIFGKPK
jgi:MFS superfamily sulfate permease-like transporter